MSKLYAIVESNTVVNTVLWDGESPWAPPEGTEAVEAEGGAAIGWTYDGVSFQPPPVVEEVAAQIEEAPQPTVEELKAQLDALNAQLQQLLTQQ